MADNSNNNNDNPTPEIKTLFPELKLSSLGRTFDVGKNVCIPF